MAVHKDRVDQERVNMLKILRTAIRLKYSLLADEEMNEVLPKAEAKFNAAVNRNQLPAPMDIKRALGL